MKGDQLFMTTQEKNSKRYELLKVRKRREERRLAKLRARRRNRIAAVVVLFAAITIVCGTVFNAAAKEITITEINEFTGLNETQTVRTRGGSVEEVLAKRGLDIGETDRLNVPASKPIEDNDDIVIKRGKRVTIKSGSDEKVVTVTKADAKDALIEAGYIPGELDQINTDGDTIELVSISRSDEVTTETIERGVEYVDDPNLPQGQEKVIDEGQDGIKEIQHKVTYQDGEESERLVLGENITQEPRNKIIAKGTAAATPAPSRSDVSDDGGSINGYKYKRKITMTATAYSASHSENGGFAMSAMGTALRYGIVAVDPDVVPLGSRVYVTAPDGSWSYGVAVAEDTGGAIKGNRIDLCYPAGADSFGRKSCVVYVLE